MNNRMMALLIKFIGMFAATWLAFGYIMGSSLSNVLIVALIVTVLNYILGDLIILPAFGNIVASIADGLLGALVAFLMGLILPVFCTNLLSLAFYAAIIMVFEYIFHMFLMQGETKSK